MINYAITVDSGCDLSMEMCREKNIIPIFMEYLIDGETFTDRMEVSDIKVFYDKMRAGAVAKTTQINAHSFKEFFRPFVERGEKVVHISLSSGLSGTYSNACDAVREMGWEDKVYVIDSLNASAACALLALEAARLRSEGVTAERCAGHLSEMRWFVNSVYTTDDLTYLCRGGRVSKFSAKMAGALNICPILDVDSKGCLRVSEKVRGLSATTKRFVEKIADLTIEPANQSIIIAHSDCQDKAKEIGTMLMKKCGFKSISYTYIGSIIGSHTGPGLVAVFFVGKQRTESDNK